MLISRKTSLLARIAPAVGSLSIMFGLIIAGLSFKILEVLVANTAEPFTYWEVPVLIGLVVPAIVHLLALQRATASRPTRFVDTCIIVYICLSFASALILVFWLNKVWMFFDLLHISGEEPLFFILGMMIAGNGVGCLYYRTP